MTGDEDEEDEEDYMNFVVIDEFHVKFGPAVSSISVALKLSFVIFCQHSQSQGQCNTGNVSVLRLVILQNV